MIRNGLLDLGVDVNIIPRKTWESMGKPTLYEIAYGIALASGT